MTTETLDCVEVPLTRGLVAMVDQADADRVLAHRWHAHRPDPDGPHYAERTERRPDGTRGTVRLHAFLTGWPLVDHVNGDGLDNRRSNLRPATDAQNGRNRGANRNNTSGYKGVSLDKRRGTWAAALWVAGRKHHLGTHATPEAAAHAYDHAAVELHGEFARLNFPDHTQTCGDCRRAEREERR